MLSTMRGLFRIALVLAPFAPAHAADSDGDGIADDIDNCPYLASTNQSDSDKDGYGDLCDNCPSWANANQSDTDHDGYGNACDGDFNGDLHTNFADLAYFRSVFNSTNSPANLLDELNTYVDLTDLARLKELFLNP